MREVLTRLIHLINQQIRTTLVDIQSSRHFVATECTVGDQEHLERIGIIAENMETRTTQKDEGLFLRHGTNDKLLIVVQVLRNRLKPPAFLHALHFVDIFLGHIIAFLELFQQSLVVQLDT